MTTSLLIEAGAKLANAILMDFTSRPLAVIRDYEPPAKTMRYQSEIRTMAA